MTFRLRLLTQRCGVDDGTVYLQNKGILFHVTGCDLEKGWMFRRGMEGNIKILPHETFSRERFESLPHYNAKMAKGYCKGKEIKDKPLRDNCIWAGINFLKALSFMGGRHGLKLTPGQVLLHDYYLEE